MTDTVFILSLSDSPQRHAGARFTPNPKSQKHSQPSMPATDAAAIAGNN